MKIPCPSKNTTLSPHDLLKVLSRHEAAKQSCPAPLTNLGRDSGDVA